MVIDLKDKRIFRNANLRVLIFGIAIFVVAALVYAGKIQLILLPESISKILSSLIIIIGSYFIASVFVRLTLKRIINSIDSGATETKLLMTKFYSAGIYILVTTIVLWELGVTIQNIALIIGFMATGLAFAVRDVILSYMVWYMLLRKKPFRIGDYIRIGDDEGKVVHIGTFFVLLDDTPDRKEDYVRVPNKIFLEKSVRNFGSGKIEIKVKIKVQNTKDMNSLLSRVKKKLKDAIISLETNNEGVWIKAEYLTSIEKKKENKTKIITIIAEELSKKK